MYLIKSRVRVMRKIVQTIIILPNYQDTQKNLLNFRQCVANLRKPTQHPVRMTDLCVSDKNVEFPSPGLIARTTNVIKIIYL